MVNELIEIVNEKYGNIVIIDDSVSISDIYEIVILICEDKYMNVYNSNFMRNTVKNKLPQPTNVSEQIKYIKAINAINSLAVPPM